MLPNAGSRQEGSMFIFAVERTSVLADNVNSVSQTLRVNFFDLTYRPIYPYNDL